MAVVVSSIEPAPEASSAMASYASMARVGRARLTVLGSPVGSPAEVEEGQG